MVLFSLWFPCIWNNLFIFAVGRIPPWRGWQDNFTNCFTSFLSRSPLLHWEESTMPQTSKDKVKKNKNTKPKLKTHNFFRKGSNFSCGRARKSLIKFSSCKMWHLHSPGSCSFFSSKPEWMHLELCTSPDIVLPDIVLQSTTPPVRPRNVSIKW